MTKGEVGLNPVMEAIQKRRSIRRFKPNPVDDDKITAILEAGRWAPSFSNLQPWTFIVVTDSKLKRQLEIAVAGSVRHRGIEEAPVVIVTCVDPSADPQHHVEDGSAATQNMTIAAYSLGLGSFWVGVLNTSAEEGIRKILNVPLSQRIVSLLPIGTPAEVPSGVRKMLEEIVRREKYGNR